MSSEEIATKIKSLIKSFLKCLENLADHKCGILDGISHSIHFYKYGYDLARLMYLYPNYRELFTDEDKKDFKENILKAFVKLLFYTDIIIDSVFKYSINIAKTKLSEMSFIKNEIFGFYKELIGIDLKLTLNEENAMKDLEDMMERISGYIEYSFEDIDFDDLPNLNGVPESHTWWTTEQRELWKNKSIFDE